MVDTSLWDEGVTHLRQALLSQPQDDPDRPETLRFLGMALELKLRYIDPEPNIATLDEEVGALREALMLYPPGHRGRAGAIQTLSQAELRSRLIPIGEPPQTTRVSNLFHKFSTFRYKLYRRPAIPLPV